MYKIGRLEIPCAILVGNGKTIFTLKRGFCNQKVEFIPEITNLILRNHSRYKERRSYNGQSVRLVEFEIVQMRHGGNQSTKKPDYVENQLRALFGPMDFFSFLTTNVEIDEKMFNENGEKLSLREKFLPGVGAENIFSYRQILSLLTGPVAVLVTKDSKTILCQRSWKVAVNPGIYSVSLTEAMEIGKDVDSEGVPDPALSATRGAHEELGIYVPPNRFRCLGIVASHKKMVPEFIYMAELDQTWDELRIATAQAEDQWEGKTFTIDFTPEAVWEYLNPEFLAKNNTRFFEVGVINLVFALINKFGRKKVEKTFAQ